MSNKTNGAKLVNDHHILINSEGKEYIVIDKNKIFLFPAETDTFTWLGREELKRQMIAAWNIVCEKDVPLNPTLSGPTGGGKTILPWIVGKELGFDIYIQNCLSEMSPKDLIIEVSRYDKNEGIVIHQGTPLLTAVLKGGVCILDEANRMPERSWASLASLLDWRRYLEILGFGEKFHAHPNFRFVATLNQDDASTYDLPNYIKSRLGPNLKVEALTQKEITKIIHDNVPFASVNDIKNIIDLYMTDKSSISFDIRKLIEMTLWKIKLIKTGFSSEEIDKMIIDHFLDSFGESYE